MRQKRHYWHGGDIIFSVLQSFSLASGEADSLVIHLLFFDQLALSFTVISWLLSVGAAAGL